MQARQDITPGRNSGMPDADTSMALIADLYNRDARVESEQPLALYQKVYYTIRDLIVAGRLPRGSQLPTLQTLADGLDLSRGTVNHAYRLLDEEGFVAMTQGKGSFVVYLPQQTSRKERAEQAIDSMLSELVALQFSRQEIRIFLDLKMREFYEEKNALRIAVFASCLEDRYIYWREFSAYLDAAFAVYSLDDLLAGKFDPDLYDGIICTDDLYLNIRIRLNADVERKLIPACAELDPHTVLALSDLPADNHLVLLCHSKQFARRMGETCEAYSQLTNSPQTLLLSEGKGDDLDLILRETDTILFPFACYPCLTNRQKKSLANFVQGGGNLLDYQLRPDKSSLLAVRLRLEEVTGQRKES